MASLACDDERRVPWPAELGWSKAHARFMFAYADTDCDDDELPDAYSPTGTITFSWDSPSFRFTPEEGEPIGLAATSVTAQILPDGTIALDGSKKTENGYIVFMPTVNPRLEPNESTILVSFSVAGASFSPVRFAPEPGKDYNLIAMVDIPASTGAVTIVSTDTALRAELAAQRAEEAAAGVADISEQVTQVQTYALTAQNAASQTEATLVNAVQVAGKLSEDSAAMQEQVDYLRDVIAQHGTLKGDKGDPGPAPAIEWQGDRLSVNGELGPALTGAPGQDGGPVPAGGTAGRVITRTADGVAWADAALYKSMRLTLHDAGGYKVKLRRVGDLVICSIHVQSNVEKLSPLSIPLGYRRADPVDLQRLMYRGGVGDNNNPWGAVRFSDQMIVYNGRLDTINAALVEVWDTDDPHPII